MILLLLLLFALTGTAGASTLTYTYTLTGTVPDGPVSAQAVLTLDTAANTLEVILSNLLVNPTSDGQLISGLFVGGMTGTPVLASSFANEGNPPGSTVSPRPGGTGWGFGATGGGYEICVICPSGITAPGHTAPPSLMIIGPPDGAGQYSNANSSIYVHSPYLFEQATFHLTGVTGIQSDGAGLMFGFGGQPVNRWAGDPVITNGGLTESSVPEPGAWVLAAAGLVLIGLGTIQKQRFRRVRALAGRKE